MSLRSHASLNLLAFWTCLALAFVSSWPDLVGHAQAFFAPAHLVSSALTNPRVFFSAGMGTCALLFAVSPRLLSRHESLTCMGAAVGGALATAVFAAVAHVPAASFSVILASVGAFVVGFTHGWITVLALATLAQLPTSGSIAAVCCCALLLKTAVDDFFGPLSYLVQTVSAVLMPVFAATCILLGKHARGANIAVDLAELPKISGVLKRIALVVLVMNAVLHAVGRSVSALGFWGDAQGMAAGLSPAFALSVALLAAMVWLTLARTRGNDMLTRYIPAFLLLLAGFFLLDASEGGALGLPTWTSDTLSRTVELYAHALYWGITAECVRKLDLHPLRVVGIAVFSMNVASVVMSLFLQSLSQSSGGAVMAVAYAFTALMVVLARGTSGADSMALSEKAVGSTEREEYECIARSANLTPRETEVFMLLAQGRDQAFIHEELYISEATIKTHSRHIYAKLGVANKQELISYVVERRKQG